jgi:hypothetical protein
MTAQLFLPSCTSNRGGLVDDSGRVTIDELR